MNASSKLLINKMSYDAVDDKDVLALISAIKKGINYRFFSTIAGASPFTISEWSGFLNISERTMQRYKKDKKSFDPAQSDRILQIALLNKFGVEVFGSEGKFNLWLDAKNVALGNVKPKSFLDNSFGINMVRDELTRIEYGVLA